MVNIKNENFIKYKWSGLVEAAKIILKENLYENKNSYNYNMSKAIIKENVKRDYEIVFLVNRKFGYCGVCIIDEIYYKYMFEMRFLTKDIENIVNEKMKFVSCYVKEKYRRIGLGSILLSQINKNNVFAREGISNSISMKFWNKNGINVFSTETNMFI